MPKQTINLLRPGRASVPSKPKEGGRSTGSAARGIVKDRPASPARLERLLRDGSVDRRLVVRGFRLHARGVRGEGQRNAAGEGIASWLAFVNFAR